MRETDPATSDLIRRIGRLLEELDRPLPEDAETIRSEVRRLAEILKATRRIGRVRLTKVITAEAARERILVYLKLFVDRVIEGEELQVVAGIQEFARRVRELRVEHGYNISTGTSREDLRPDQYILEGVESDADAAEKWKIANRIRRQAGSGRDRVIAFLKENMGRSVTGEQLAYVAKVREAGRRTRELRTEYGYRVVTRFTGRPDLPGGVYVLESVDQLPPHDRHIPDAVYDQVLRRDDNRCRKCGWSVEMRRPEEKRQFLEVHHIEFHAEGGPNNPENLVTLCNVHHDEVHRLGLTGEGFFEWIKRG